MAFIFTDLVEIVESASNGLKSSFYFTKIHNDLVESHSVAFIFIELLSLFSVITGRQAELISGTNKWRLKHLL